MRTSWGRLADFSQKTISLCLVGLTIYGAVMLVNGGRGVFRRRKERKLQLEAEQASEQD